MNQAASTSSEAFDAFSEGDVEDEFESMGDHHRAAAQHFAAAARHHLVAAEAADEGDDDTTNRHAYMAYRHQLNGVQYAEIAVMDSESVEDALESGL